MANQSRTIAIFGQYKTGTTALFSQIRDALPADTIALMEPSQYRPGWRDGKHPVLAKVILALYEGPGRVHYDHFTGFDHKIFLVRDPRDRLVSGILFTAQQNPAVYGSPDKLARVLDLFARKSAEPRKMSFRELAAEVLKEAGGKSLPEVMEELQAHHRWIYDFDARLHGHFRLRYRDFIDRKLSALEDYLGLPLPTDVKIDPQHNHVIRTRQYGDWKNWFLAEDVEYFRPFTEEYLRHYGFEEDWEINANPVIPPEHSVEYVRRTVGKRNRN